MNAEERAHELYMHLHAIGYVSREQELAAYAAAITAAEQAAVRAARLDCIQLVHRHYKRGPIVITNAIHAMDETPSPARVAGTQEDGR